jgi:hypothetical protein
MSLPGYVGGMPRIGALRQTSPKIIFLDGQVEWGLAGGKVIIGSKSRDPDNTGNIDVLRPGLLMGKQTSGGKYAPSVIGVLGIAYVAGGTTLTVGAQVCTEIIRRVGATGTLKITGPPTANGTIARETVTYSAVGATTITVTALANSYVAGSLIGANDGTADPLTLIPEINAGTGLKVTDNDDVSNLDQPFAWFPIGGVIIAANIINYGTDSSIQNFIKTTLSTLATGKFCFDDTY